MFFFLFFKHLEDFCDSCPLRFAYAWANGAPFLSILQPGDEHVDRSVRRSFVSVLIQEFNWGKEAQWVHRLDSISF